MKKVLAALVLMLGLTFANQASAQEIVKHVVKDMSVEKSVKLLEKSIESKGLTVFETIDHMEAAKEAGLKMKPAVVVIFGNPKVGTELMNANIAWSYELPLKIAVYEDAAGETWLHTRLLPTDVAAPGQEKRIEAMNNLLKSIVLPAKGDT